MRHRLAAILLWSLQALAVGGWWVALVLRPDWRHLFLPASWPWAALQAFWLPDLVLVAAGALACAWGRFQGARWLPAVAWLVAGAAGYATLYTVAVAVAGRETWPAVAAMMPLAVLDVALAMGLRPAATGNRW